MAIRALRNDIQERQSQRQFGFFITMTQLREKAKRRCIEIERVDMRYYVYLLSNATKVTLYVGVTNDLIRRVYEHKQHSDPNSFTTRYKIERLVYFEETTDVRAAIQREKQIKSWSRARKNQLVESMNPAWKDLYPSLLE